MNRFAFLFNRYKKIDAAFVPVSILHIPKNERQGWFMRTTFFYPLHADLLCRQLERGEKSKPLTLVFLHSQQQERGQSATLGLATASPSPTLDRSATTMYNESVGDILQAT